MQDYTQYIKIVDGNGKVIPWEYNQFPDGQVQAKIKKTDFPERTTKDMEVDGETHQVGSWRMYASIPNPIVLDLYYQLTTIIDLWEKHTILYCYGARCDKNETETYFVCPVARHFLDMVFDFAKWNRETINVENMTLLAPHCHNLVRDHYGFTLKTDYSIPDSINLGDWDLVVFPDQSAYERFGNAIGEMSYVICEKHRNQDDGSIVEYKIPDIVSKYSRLILIDDICDGGATFFATRSALLEKNPNIVDVSLFIVHGVFSNNAVDRLLNSFNLIMVSNSLPTVAEQVNELSDDKKNRVIVYDVWGDQ